MDVTDELRTAVSERAEAIAGGDRAALERLMHPACLWTTHTGLVLDRDDYIERNAAEVQWDGQEVAVERIHVEGTTAVVLGVVSDTTVEDSAARGTPGRALSASREEFTLSDLARLLGVSPGALHAEAERLVHAGLLTDRRLGRSRLLQANTSARGTRPLTELLMATYGPQLVVADEFADVPGTKQVVLYGSWARRYRHLGGTEQAGAGELGDVLNPPCLSSR